MGSRLNIWILSHNALSIALRDSESLSLIFLLREIAYKTRAVASVLPTTAAANLHLGGAHGNSCFDGLTAHCFAPRRPNRFVNDAFAALLTQSGQSHLATP